jgi:hypothetical protein
VQLCYLSPLGWEHINLTGDYLWRSSAKIGADKFRPLWDTDSSGKVTRGRGAVSRFVDAERAGAERRTELEQVLARVELAVGNAASRLNERLPEIVLRPRDAKSPSNDQAARRPTRPPAKRSTKERAKGNHPV